MTRLVVVAFTVLLAAGCGTSRSYVVKPDDVGRLNNADWTVKAEPHAAESEGQQ